MTRALLVALVVAVVSLSAPSAQATSCVAPELESSLERADVVFTGRATVDRETGIETLARFAVSRVFKGTVPLEVRVRGGGLAGASFQTGKRYLVFAKLEPNGQLWAHLCGGTGAIDPAWLSQLGAGTSPSIGGDPVAGSASSPDAQAVSEPAESSDASSQQPARSPETGAPAPPAEPSDSAAKPVPPRGGCGACGVGAPVAPVAPVPLHWPSLLLLVAGRLRRQFRP